MTAREIATRLIAGTGGITPTRVAKAKALAVRSGVAWTDVLAVLTESERQAVEAADD
jgi:hypothetical protein